MQNQLVVIMTWLELWDCNNLNIPLKRSWYCLPSDI